MSARTREDEKAANDATAPGGVTTRSITDAFPFDEIVLTFPDERSAEAATKGPLVALQQELSCMSSIRRTIIIRATCDPHGARVGSGGGTLHALTTTTTTSTSANNPNKSVLVIHAGGESSRCPTQMVMGKAWTHLPTNKSHGNADTSDHGDTEAHCFMMQTPLHVWLDLCSRLFVHIPQGSVVVVASDTLLHVPSSSSSLSTHDDWNKLPPNSVVGLAVPAPFATAKNHGVYLVDDHDTAAADDNDSFLLPCRMVLQKPTVDSLQKTCHRNHNNNNNNSETTAWIDTGVVIFPPTAAAVLKRLAQTTLSRCTGVGLRAAHHEATTTTTGGVNNNNNKEQQQQQQTIHEFSQANAIKLDLYTHFLRAFSLVDDDKKEQQQMMMKQEYIDQHHDIDETIASALHDALHIFSLTIWGVKKGSFLHLGTTRELLDFYIHGTTTRTTSSSSTSAAATTTTDNKMSTPITQRHELCRDFGNSLGLTSRLGALTMESSVVDSFVVIMQSSVKAGRVDAGSVIEYCQLENLNVGSGCLVSGLVICQDDDGAGVTEETVVVPNGVMIQQTPLQSGYDVIMVVGVDDNIKGEINSFCGRGVEEFLKWSGMSKEDLWDDGIVEPMLWNARLHPILEKENDSFRNLWSWLDKFVQDEPLSLNNDSQEEQSLVEWKARRRLSLAEVRNQADAAAAFTRLENLRKKVIPQKIDEHLKQVREIVCGRKHELVDLTFARDEFRYTKNAASLKRTLLMLDSIVQESMSALQYDICGRTCMILNSALAGLPSNSEAHYEIESTVDDLVACVESGVTCDEYINRLVHARTAALSVMAPLEPLVEGYERLARACIARCVRPNFPRLERRSKPVMGRWIIATSPVRVDLAGGWTDTPPICNEFGSSVTGLAVEIDGHRPLSCRARIIPGENGILLRSEDRDLKDGSLAACSEIDIAVLGDFKGYNDPLADCALLKCALLCLGVASPAVLSDDSLKGRNVNSLLESFFGISECVRLEVISSSLLPHGSGLGTSSILAGCILSAVGQLVGVKFAPMELIDAVLVLEQLLTTGGGFQDQVNGLLGGAKITRCLPSPSKVDLSCETISLLPRFQESLSNRLILVHTGKTRLAKNILQQVLRRWAGRSGEIMETVRSLISTSDEACAALHSSDMETLGKCLTRYWEQKKRMAGSDSNVEPSIVSQVLSELVPSGAVLGGSLCGAGGGGFLVLLASASSSIEKLQNELRKREIATDSLSWHECAVCSSGIVVSEKPSTHDFTAGEE